MYAGLWAGALAGNRKTRNVCGRTANAGGSRESADDRKTSQRSGTIRRCDVMASDPRMYECGARDKKIGEQAGSNQLAPLIFAKRIENM